MKPPVVSPLVLRALNTGEEDLGIEELANRLGVTVKTIHAWRHGDAEVPDDSFLRLVETLTELDPQWMARGPGRQTDRPAILRARRLAAKSALLTAAARDAINKAYGTVKIARAIKT
ncbi:MAG: hypothetical protein ABR570_05160 [Burkholderiales bacterium]